MTACDTENRENNEQGVGPRFFGKYRGKVISNLNPHRLGRIIAIVPFCFTNQPYIMGISLLSLCWVGCRNVFRSSYRC